MANRLRQDDLAASLPALLDDPRDEADRNAVRTMAVEAMHEALGYARGMGDDQDASTAAIVVILPF